MTMFLLTVTLTKRTDATYSGFRYPGSYSNNLRQETRVNGPGALRECPEGREALKGAWRREPSSEPPDYGLNHGTGIRKMGMASKVIADNVTDLIPIIQENRQRTASARENAAPLPWSVDQLGAPVEGMVQIEACISVESLRSLMLLLQHPGYVVVVLDNGDLALDHVPPVMGDKLIK